MSSIKRLVVATAALAASLATISFSGASEVHAKAATNPNKITICHRTHSVTNPYRKITVNKSSIADDITSATPVAGKRGHGQISHNEYSTVLYPSGKPNPNVFNPSMNYTPAPEKLWGDIIPDKLDGGGSHNAAAMGLNYTGAGLAIYNGTTYNGVNYAGYCGRKSAAKYCADEIPALVAMGKTQAQAEAACLEDLEEQNSYDDEANKSACNGNFTTCSLATLSAVSAATGTLTCKTTSSVTLTGTATVGSATVYPVVDYGTSSTLATYTSVDATPATLTGTASFTATLTGLSAGTYYVRSAVETANQGRLEGAISSFTITASKCTVTSQAVTDGTTSGGTTIAAGKGALKGTVWIDTNLNKKKGKSEKGLTKIKVTAVLVGTGTTVTVKTDSKGAYEMTNLDPGVWKVTALTLPNGYVRTFDTDSTSAVDWKAKATVPVGGYGQADFAAVSVEGLPATGTSHVMELLAVAALMMAAGVVLMRRRSIA